MEHLAAGRITEWRATIVCRETAVLDVERRREVDARLAADLPLLGDAQIAQRARAMACELDGGAVVRRRAKAESERRVTLRPAPDTMTTSPHCSRWRRVWRSTPPSLPLRVRPRPRVRGTREAGASHG